MTQLAEAQPHADAASTAPARRRSARSHAAVLKAACDLAGSRGYAATSIEEIAAAAGVGKQTIYRWWPNKAALFIEVYGSLVPTDFVADDTGTLAGDLAALLTRLSRLYVRTPAGNILSGLIAEAQTAGALAAQLRDAYVIPRRTIVRTIFARAVARREIAPPVDLDFLSDLLSGAVWFRLLLGTRHLDRRFRQSLIETLLRAASGAAPPPGQPQRQKVMRHDRADQR
jgi:AcrR family transcriptional regulator